MLYLTQLSELHTEWNIDPIAPVSIRYQYQRWYHYYRCLDWSTNFNCAHLLTYIQSWVRFFDLSCPLPDGDDLPKVQFIIVHLGDEDGCHGLIERRTIHVDGGPDRQHEADDASVDMVVLK